tara:strand:- start:19134 stop:20153 length:1020 start_codon:yes stop_codon:yes gene_type:complete
MTIKIEEIAKKLVENGKGILAADESTGTIKKRFDQISVESSAENRRDYREMLFRAEDAMTKYISGVILYDETLRQTCKNGSNITDLLKSTDTLIGIKVDTGAKPLAMHPNETITEGLDNLKDRLLEYKELGATFAKWRAVISISDVTPSEYAIKSNSQALARYSAICQEVGIVPIVEPEVLMDGTHSSHTIQKCKQITVHTLNTVFAELQSAKVNNKGIILKPNMVIQGKNCNQKATAIEVATETLDCLESSVPIDVPGICFLSGGQSDIQATEHLSIMNSSKKSTRKLSFSYGRALQQSALLAWKGSEVNIKDAQDAFAHRAKMNGLAAMGKWSNNLE